MKAKLFSCLFAAVVVAGITSYRPAADQRIDAIEIDFADLHSQASSALQTLQLSREHRMAFQQIDTSEF
jgi:hypothetical protein